MYVLQPDMFILANITIQLQYLCNVNCSMYQAVRVPHLSAFTDILSLDWICCLILNNYNNNCMFELRSPDSIKLQKDTSVKLPHDNDVSFLLTYKVVIYNF